MRRRDVEGNRALTATVAALLLVLLLVEGLTLVAMRPLLPVHIFVGMLLVPLVALKLVVVSYRFARYYLRDFDYRTAGPPQTFLRLLGPPLVLSTGALFGTGVALVLLGRSGILLGLHKASFVVWFGAMGVHVLAHARRVLDVLRRRVPGTGRRIALVGASVLAGAVIATATIPKADVWQDRNLPEAVDVG